MDEVTRAELATLRRRAFGPAPDIDGDPVARARLEELEGLARQERAAAIRAEDAASASLEDAALAMTAERAVPRAADAASTTDAAPPEDAAAPAGPAGQADSSGPAPPARRRGLAVAAVGVIALAVAAAQVTAGLTTSAESAAPTPTASPTPVAVAAAAAIPDGTVLLQIPLDRSLARYVQPSPPPAFPIPEDLQWATSIGTYYGWDLWLARSRSGHPCILVARDGMTKGQCVADQVFREHGVSVALGYGSIDAVRRPQQMDATERIEYWWLPQRGAVVVLGGGTLTYFGDP
ncbi:hypothetical protein [Microbacterium aureliae]